MFRPRWRRSLVDVALPDGLGNHISRRLSLTIFQGGVNGDGKEFLVFHLLDPGLEIGLVLIGHGRPSFLTLAAELTVDGPYEFPSRAPAVSLTAAVQEMHLETVVARFALHHLHQMAIAISFIEKTGQWWPRRSHGAAASLSRRAALGGEVA